ncbi:YkvA family protein [Cognatiluteimonas profundi]|uniref:YkvA family protein n=1 Tax=Cognatiluteimonas profundi TaxID=2594501 RepID=UPI00131DB325|nr:YkvA family protein [Lysobacter profundi]
MNALLAQLHPLPAELPRPAHSAHGRRHRIGTHEINEQSLALFNELLMKLDLRQPQLERDQLVTAARDVANRPDSSHAAIFERMRRAAAIDRMLRDHGWTPADQVVPSAQLVVEYVRRANDLIPDALPMVGRLDDAIVVDVAWPALAPEVGDYIDFCRLRHVETALGGTADGYDRDSWLAARRAEARLLEHLQRVGAQTYLSGPPALFHVH